MWCTLNMRRRKRLYTQFAIFLLLLLLLFFDKRNWFPSWHRSECLTECTSARAVWNQTDEVLWSSFTWIEDNCCWFVKWMGDRLHVAPFKRINRILTLRNGRCGSKKCKSEQERAKWVNGHHFLDRVWNPFDWCSRNYGVYIMLFELSLCCCCIPKPFLTPFDMNNWVSVADAVICHSPPPLSRFVRFSFM